MNTLDISLFVRTADLGSFVAVGHEAKLTPSAVARMVSRLEAHLGVKLLHRSTRRLVLTQEGETYLHHARAIVVALEEAAAEVGTARGTPQGVVRVNTGTAFAKHRLVPRLPEFLDRFPELRIELVVSDQRIDPVLSQIDISVRGGPLDDSSLVLVPLGTIKRVIVASPSYLSRRGVPRLPSDLLNHNCLQLSGFDRLARWPMIENGVRRLISVQGSVKCDSADVLLDLALAGVGIIRLGDFFGERALADGRLVALLEDSHDTDPIPLSALLLPGRQHLPKVRAVLSFLQTLGGTTGSVVDKWVAEKIASPIG